MDHATLVTISHLQASRYNIVASQLLLIYDTILCANREYKYIWKARWSFGKALYVLVRYTPLLVNSVSTFSPYRLGADPPPQYCRTISRMETYVGVIQLALFHTTVATRTHALCRDIWWAKSLLVFTIVGCAGSFFVLNYLWIPNILFSPNPLSGIVTGCVITLSPCAKCGTYLDWWWVPVLMPGVVIFVMTLLVAIQSWRMQAQTRLLTVLYRDGFLYCTAIFCVNLIQCIIWKVGPDSAWGLIYGYGRSLDAILCCRLFLNLRGALTKPSEYRTETRRNRALDTLPLTTIAFAPVGLEDTFGTWGISARSVAVSEVAVTVADP